VRRIEDDAAWVPRTFDPDEKGSIDMWLGPVRRVSSQVQLQSDEDAATIGIRP
jgi:2,3-dihydroxy-p-cumate/2,3-dihydroxybenzoate 3,4-dioxygenase